MNKSINLEIKGQLAKLLATEDLIIENKQVETAMFNVETRVLTLPMWDAEENVYDMLVAHEVGHALFTPNKDPRKGIPQTFINVTEDARIEKLMKRKYEGLPKTFYGGYNQLYKDDFFDLAGVDIDNMNLADRINLHFKIGPFMGIQFDEEEQIIVDATANAETFDDAQDAAEMLYNYCKQELAEQEAQQKKEEEEFEAMMKMEGNNSEGDDMNEDVFESYNEDQLDNDTDEEGEGNPKSGRPDLGEDDTEYDDIKESVAGNEASGPPEQDSEPQVRTDTALAKAIKDLVNDEAQPNEYIELPQLNLNTIINPNAAVHAYIEDYWRQFEIDRKNYNEGYEYLLEDYARVEQAYQKYRKEAQKEVNYLVKEFECKKSAAAYARATTSRTGILDTSKLHTYKFNEDLFKKVSVVPDGKNHGLIFILDWSGSMSNVMMDTIKQLFNLVWFCKKVNIPFEVYAFTNSYPNPNREEIVQKDLTLHMDGCFSLLNILTSKTRAKDMNEQLKNIFRLAFAFQNRGAYYRCPLGMSLSGTPLNEALVCLHSILPQFRKENGLQKVQCVVLTDGESQSIRFNRELQRDWEENTYMGSSYLHDNCYIRNRKTGYVYGLENMGYYGDVTDVLLKDLRQSFPDTNFIGIRLMPNGWASSFIQKYTEGHEYEKSLNYWRKNKTISLKTSGYHVYFGLSSTAIGNNAEFEVQEDATKAQIKKAFNKSLKSKKMNKKILGEFIELVA